MIVELKENRAASKTRAIAANVNRLAIVQDAKQWRCEYELLEFDKSGIIRR